MLAESSAEFSLMLANCCYSHFFTFLGHFWYESQEVKNDYRTEMRMQEEKKLSLFSFALDILVTFMFLLEAPRRFRIERITTVAQEMPL